MTMLGRILQLQQRRSRSVLDGKCLITYYTARTWFPLIVMKHWLGGRHFGTDDELQTSVENWLKAQAAAFYEEGIGKLVSRYDKRLNRSSDYVEK